MKKYLVSFLVFTASLCAESSVDVNSNQKAPKSLEPTTALRSPLIAPIFEGGILPSTLHLNAINEVQTLLLQAEEGCVISSSEEGKLSFTSADALIEAVLGAHVINVDIEAKAPLTITHQPLGDLTFNGVIRGSFITTKGAGDSFILLNSNNTFSHLKVVSGNTYLGTDGALGEASVSLSGGTLGALDTDITMKNAIFLEAASSMRITKGSTMTIGGDFSGKEDLTLVGGGKVVFTGENTYAGTLHVKDGALSAGSDAAFGASSLCFSGGALENSYGKRTLANNILLMENMAIAPSFGGVFTLGGVLSGAGSLEMKGPGALALTGRNTYEGTTKIYAGRVLASNSSSLGAGSIDCIGGSLENTGNNLTLSNPISLLGSSSIVSTEGSDFRFEGKLKGAGSLDFRGPGAVILAHSENATTGLFTIHAGALLAGADRAFGSASISLHGGKLGALGPLTAIENAISVSSKGAICAFAGASLRLDGLISGAGRLTFSGEGTKIVRRDNAFAGTATLLEGKTLAGEDGAFGSGIITLAGGTLGGLGESRIVANPIFLFDRSKIFQEEKSSLTLSGEIFGSGDLEFTGSGDIFLTGVNAQTGSSIITSGRVSVGSNKAFGTGQILLHGGELTSLGNRCLANDISLSFPSSIHAPLEKSITLSGEVVGKANLTLSGQGEVIFQGPNSYEGTTIFSSGIGSAASSSAFGVGKISLQGGTLSLSGRSQTLKNDIFVLSSSSITVPKGRTLALSGSLFGKGDVTCRGQGTLLINEKSSLSGSLILQGGTLSLGKNSSLGESLLFFDGGKLKSESSSILLPNDIVLQSEAALAAKFLTTLKITGKISGEGSLAIQGPGTVTLCGANTFSKGSSLNGGKVLLENESALGKGALTLCGGALGGSLKELRVSNPMILEATGIIEQKAESFLTLTGAITGDHALEFTGEGKVLVKGENSYTGGTIIRSGTVFTEGASSFSEGKISLCGGALGSFSGVQVITNAISLDAASRMHPNAESTLILEAIVSGTSPLRFTGSGDTLLQGINTYTGSSRIEAGRVFAESSSAFGAGSIFLAAGTIGNYREDQTIANNIILLQESAIVSARDSTLTLAGEISGKEDLFFAGKGKTLLLGKNTLKGKSILKEGAVFAGSDQAFGSGEIHLCGGDLQLFGEKIYLQNNISVDIPSSIHTPIGSELTLAGNFSGSSPPRFVGGGRTILTGVGTLQAGAILSEGTVFLGNNDAFGVEEITLHGGSLFCVGESRHLPNDIFLADTSFIGAPLKSRLTLSGDISGKGDLTIYGDGEILLQGNSAHEGTTRISSGVATVGSSLAFGSGRVSLEGGMLSLFEESLALFNDIVVQQPSAMHVPMGKVLTLDGALSGKGDLTYTGKGTLLLQGRNSVSGTITLLEGTVAVGTDSAFGESALILDGGKIENTSSHVLLNNPISLKKGGALEARPLTTLEVGGEISGEGILHVEGLGTVTFQSANTFTGGATLHGGKILLGNDSAMGEGALILDRGFLGGVGKKRVMNNAIVLKGPLQIEQGENTLFQVAGAISGTQDVEFVGKGEVVLSGENTYLGNTIIKEGTVVAKGSSPFGKGSILLCGGRLSNHEDATLVNAISVDQKSVIFSAPESKMHLQGVVSGEQMLTFSGKGDVILSGLNTFSGGGKITAGRVLAASSSALGLGDIFLEAGALGNFSKDHTISNDITLLKESSIVSAKDSTLTLLGKISGEEDLFFTGSGTTLIRGENTLQGKSILTQGKVLVNSDHAFGSGEVSLKGGELQSLGEERHLGNNILIDAPSAIHTPFGKKLTLTGALSGSSRPSFIGGGTTILQGEGSLEEGAIVKEGIVALGDDHALGTGLITLEGGSLFSFGEDRKLANAIFLASPSVIGAPLKSRVTLTGEISGESDLTLHGEVLLKGASTYKGDTILSSGIARLGHRHAFGEGRILLEGGALSLCEENQTLLNDIVVHLSSFIDVPLGKALTLEGSLFGQGDITCSGEGTLVLSGKNSLSGTLTLLSATVSPKTSEALGKSVLIFDGGRLENAQKDLLFSNDISLKSAAFFLANSLTRLEAAGKISGEGSLVVEGPGICIISGENTFQGGATLKAGKTLLGSKTALGKGAVTLDGGSLGSCLETLTINNPLVLTKPSKVAQDAGGLLKIKGAISGDFDLTFTGGGEVVLCGENTYKGRTIIRSGTVAPEGKNRFSSEEISLEGGVLASFSGAQRIKNSISVKAASSLDSKQGSSLILEGTLSGISSLTFTGGGDTVLQGMNTYEGGSIIQGGRVFAGSSSAFGLGSIFLDKGAIGNSLQDQIIENRVIARKTSTILAAKDTTLLLSGKMSGSGDLYFAGRGKTVIRGDNERTGKSAILQGIVAIESDQAFGSGELALHGGKCMALGEKRILANPISVHCPSFLEVPKKTRLTLMGEISGSGELFLQGDGELVFSSKSTHKGPITITSGVVSVGSESAFGLGKLALEGGALQAAWGKQLVTNAIFVEKASAISTPLGTTLALSGEIKGSGGITFLGKGKTILEGLSSYEGTSTIRDGVVAIGSDSAFGVGQVTLDGGALATFHGNYEMANAISVASRSFIDVPLGDALTFRGKISGRGGITFLGGGKTLFTESNTLLGTMTLRSCVVCLGEDNALGRGLVVFDGGELCTARDNISFSCPISLLTTGRIHAHEKSSLVIDGKISGIGNLQLEGPGSVFINGENIQTGTTTILSGTAFAGHDSAFGKGAVSLRGGSLSSYGNITLANPITVEGESSINLPKRSRLTLNGVLSGTCPLFFSGEGEVLLAGANTYSSTAVIKKGRVLAANNTAFGSGQIRLEGGTLASFGGSRSLSNAISVEKDSVINAPFGSTLLLSGKLSGSGDTFFTGRGTTIVTGANTCTGKTVITAGSVAAGSGSSFGSGEIFLCGGALTTSSGSKILTNPIFISQKSFIDAPLGTALTLRGSLSGEGDVTLRGEGKVALAARSDFSGALALAAGELSLETEEALGSSFLLLQGGSLTHAKDMRVLENQIFLQGKGTLKVPVSSRLELAGKISGDGCLTIAGPGELLIRASNTCSGKITLASGKTLAGSNEAFGNAEVTLKGGALKSFGKERILKNEIVLAAPSTMEQEEGERLILSGRISGSQDITFSGKGERILNGENTYTGATKVHLGTVLIGSESAFGSGEVFLDGCSLSPNGGERTLKNPISLLSSSKITGSFDSTLTLSGGIFGDCPLLFAGEGNTVLTAPSTYSSPVIIASGKVFAGDDFSLGTGGISLAGGTLATFGSTRNLANPIYLEAPSKIEAAKGETLTIRGAISGESDVTFKGEGEVRLLGENTFQGTATIAGSSVFAEHREAFGRGNIAFMGGVLQGGDVDLTFDSAIFLQEAGTIHAKAGSQLTFTGRISGNGSITVTGEGSCIFTGDNTYVGETIIRSGSLLATSADAFGLGRIVLSSAELGNLNKDMTLHNDVQVLTSSAMTIAPETSMQFTGAFSGGGDLHFPAAKGSHVVFMGNNSIRSGATILEVDTCVIGSDHAFGAGPVTFDGTQVIFTNATSLKNDLFLAQDLRITDLQEDISLLGKISGAGGIRIEGGKTKAPTILLEGENTFSGGLDFVNSHLTVRQDENLGQGPVTMDSAALTVDGTFTTRKAFFLRDATFGITPSISVTSSSVFTCEGPLTAPHGFIKSGFGEMVIVGEHPEVQEEVVVLEGTLTVAGSLPKAFITASAGAIVRGAGSLGFLEMDGGRVSGNSHYEEMRLFSGSIAPGDSIGIIDIAGDYTQAAGVVYEVEIDGEESDQIFVGGNAIIAEAAEITVLPLGSVILRGTSYDILQATTIDQLWTVQNFPEELDLRLDLVEGGTIARLTVESSAAFLGENISSASVRNLASYINNIEITENLDLQEAILAISSSSNLEKALQQLHPKGVVLLDFVSADNSAHIFQALQREAFSAARRCRPSTPKRRFIWAAPTYATSNRKNSEDIPDARAKSAGALIGYDNYFGELLIGGAVGYTHTDLSWEESLGEAFVEKITGSMYAAYERGRLKTLLSAMGGANFYHIERRIIIDGQERISKSAPEGTLFAARASGVLDLFGAQYTLLFLADLNYHYLATRSYEEKEARSLNLVIDARRSHFLYSNVGFRTQARWEGDNKCMTIYAGGSWLRKTPLGKIETRGAFQAFANSDHIFSSSFFQDPLDYGRIELGCDCSSWNMRCRASYEGEFRPDDMLHQITASLGVAF